MQPCSSLRDTRQEHTRCQFAVSCKTNIWNCKTYGWICLQIETKTGASIYSWLRDSSRYGYILQLHVETSLYFENQIYFSPFPVTTFITFNEFLKLYEAVFS